MSVVKKKEEPPLIPESYSDAPTQRLYALSLGLLCQAVKVFDFFQYLLTYDEESWTIGYVVKWMVADVFFILGLSLLRIPRLRYTTSVLALQVVTLCLLDGLLFGSITLHLGIGAALSSAIGVQRGAAPFRVTDLVPTFGLFGMNDGGDPHLLGQHTVRMSPISTAQLNPYAEAFCLQTPASAVLVPILLNNTTPIGIRYTLLPLGYGEGQEAIGKVETHDLNAKDIRAVEQARQETLELTRTNANKRDVNDPDYDEYDDDDEEYSTESSANALQKSQTLVHVRIAKPGTLRLERVLDLANVDARLTYPLEVVIAPCPKVEFVPDDISRGDSIRCAAPGVVSRNKGPTPGEDVNFNLDIFGVPPLSLRWHEDVNGRREYFTVEGIVGDQARGISGVPQMLQIPLTVSLGAIGMHTYTLEHVVDRYGNSLTPALSPMTTRMITVLRRPSVSFKTCGPGRPSSLLIGSETPVAITTHSFDPLDELWDVGIRYTPSDKVHKGWEKQLKTQDSANDIILRAGSPGEYTILGVKGKYCDGDVLSPETCKVIEMPLPSAQIEWKKIHECSGDTGVSASLLLRGTGPFQVYYRFQKDSEPPRELVKTVGGSRGEITLQPDQSGHYKFTFTHLSDANYKKVPLNGPSIEQVIHPLASADFSTRENATPGRTRRIISSCGGSYVDVPVDLKGTGPWNLNVQVVSPQGSELLQEKNIPNPRYTVRVPIPSDIDRNGGSFEVALASIEDAYGCKRPLNVPSVSVNVRRVEPTAKFYARDKREVTVLEHEKASLPLRLTGDGPWTIKYRRQEAPNRILSATLATPNDHLTVHDDGTYELIEIADVQCFGSVIPEESKFVVKWVSRPFARLSQDTESKYDAINGSHILPPICEGTLGHVDLDLSGRPPFQIMYNIARDNGAGGIKLLDQPTFNSIQPHTRFQLHTKEPGRMYYEVKQIGDAAYPLAKHRDHVIPLKGRLLFEQDVLMRPSAAFKSPNRLAYCVNDNFATRDFTGSDGTIVLEGIPPFAITLSIKNLAAGETYHTTVEVDAMSWKVNLPKYGFTSIGPYLVTIDSVGDASHCEQTVPDALHRSIWIDVAETAAIVPFDRREYFCEGETAQFQLEGNPPWTVGYRINGKSHNQQAKSSPFSLALQKPGEFMITSVAHQQTMCKTAVTDLHYTVHPLPSAQVGNGKRVLQDIHEGDQAEIVFTLSGEPPFTFTYQRSELQTKRSNKPPKILETHTVTGVTTKEYSIYSSLEGTWTVSFISDKFCRYPQVSPDSTMEKSQR